MSSRFHCTDDQYQRHIANSFSSGVSKGLVTQREADLIEMFTSELKATSSSITVGRIYKNIIMLIGTRRFFSLPYEEMTSLDLNNGISKIKNSNYKQSTKFDYVYFNKRFFLWLIENDLSTIPEKKVRAIKLPELNAMTKTCEMMLTPTEVKAIVEQCRNSRDRCFVMMLYEGAFRIGELGNLKWIQVSFPENHEWAVTVNVDDKTGKPRLIPLVMTKPYLIQYIEDNKITKEPDDFVFATFSGGLQIKYATMAKRIKAAAKRAGITKNVAPHLFRHSRISHLLSEGMGETITKQICWGNQSTNMLKTYAHISNETVIGAVAEKYGIVQKEEKKIVKVFEPQQCKRCLAVNTPTARYCSVCGIELSEEVKKQSDDLTAVITEYAKKHPEMLLKALASLE